MSSTAQVLLLGSFIESLSIEKQGACCVPLSYTTSAVADVLLDKSIERGFLNPGRLSHPNILGFREVFTTDTNLCIVVRSAFMMLLHAHIQKLPAPTGQALLIA